MRVIDCMRPKVTKLTRTPQRRAMSPLPSRWRMLLEVVPAGASWSAQPPISISATGRSMVNMVRRNDGVLVRSGMFRNSCAMGLMPNSLGRGARRGATHCAKTGPARMAMGMPTNRARAMVLAEVGSIGVDCGGSGRMRRDEGVSGRKAGEHGERDHDDGGRSPASYMEGDGHEEDEANLKEDRQADEHADEQHCVGKPIDAGPVQQGVGRHAPLHRTRRASFRACCRGR